MWWILAQISVIIFKTCFAGICRLIPCTIEPKVLRFWYHDMEIDASSINVQEEDDVSFTCDGSCVGNNYNPYLRWYGPDRYWIASQDPRDRIYVERAWSNKYQKLHIRSVKESDGGPYYCRGKLGDKTGWKLKSIILYIVPRYKHGNNHSFETSQSDRSHTTSSATTRGPRLTKTSTKQTEPFPYNEATRRHHTTMPSTHKRRGSTPSILRTTSFSDSSRTKLYSDFKTTATSKTTKPTTSSVVSREETTTSHTKTTGPPSNCSSGEFFCQNGDCISNDLRCDSFPDCFHGDDEDNCEKFFLSCSESEIACDNNIGCFSQSQACDGTAHCQDGSDEFLYRCQRTADVTFG